MPYVSMTPELGFAIKELRIANRIKSKDISAAINKSPTYVSKLEQGLIQKIDYDDLMVIFHTIFPDESTFEIRFEEFIGKCTIKHSDEEIEKQVWLRNFDTVYRKIPIPTALIDHCNQQIEIANISVAEVVARINLNEDIQDLSFELSSYKANLWYSDHDVEFIRMEVSLDDIEKILNKQVTISNYITMEALIYNILKYIIPDFDQAHDKAIKTLTEFKFYSIIAKNRKLKETTTPEERDEILTDFDKVNSKLKRNIFKNIERFSTLDIKYANEKLTSLSKTFDADPSLAIAYLGIDLSSLKDLDVATKRDFLKEIGALVKKYEAMSPKEEDIVLL